MRQLVLNISTEQAPTLDNFVVGRNHELMHLLQRVGNGTATTPDERSVYLWAAPAAGKTHLLRALAAQPRARYLAPDMTAEDFVFGPDTDLYMIDDCEQLSPALQIAAFALFNQVREHGARLIAAGSDAPAVLKVREDLRTRLGWGLIYQVHGLSDDEKIDALSQTAQARGMMLPPGVLPYLITHWQRDMRSLSAMLDALDSYSLETQRPITLPLLRSLLQRDEEAKT